MPYQDLFKLRGQVAVVTGSSKGIGRVIAETFAEAGAQVVVSSRRLESCLPVADSINACGGEAVAIPCHMSHLDQVQGLVDETLNRWGKIDVLVCNAAVNPHFGPMATVTEAAYDKIMATNVKHNLWLCNRVLPQMAERKDGSIIIVSSIGGLKGHDTLGIYAMSKAADFQLARNLAVEWGRSNIRANCIAPGLVRTDFARALWDDPDRLREATAMYPLGRIGEPEDLAGAALLLASPAGRFITGQVLVVDGGATISSGRYT